MVKKIVKFDKSLYQKSIEITKEEIESDAIKQLASDLLETMDANNNCVGLAAPQIGIHKKMIVVNLSFMTYVLINPEVTSATGKIIKREEACMSYPRMQKRVGRHKNITVKALSQWGEEINLNLTDFDARLVAHEIDHLNGITIGR